MGNMILYFYSVDGETVYKIKLQDINELAEFALAMEPLPHISETGGRVAALAVYFKLNPSSEYENIYNELMASFEGSCFLNVAIQIASLQRKILLGDTTEKTSEVLHECAKEYRRILNYSQTKVDSTGAAVHGRIY